MLKDVADICGGILTERPQFFILDAHIGRRSVTRQIEYDDYVWQN